ncbi:MAG TPA: S8 family serine peptidase [Blastocatellia bacterium]|nr:S8 family serine peptidase [Blastocatellia bacterium]
MKNNKRMFTGPFKVISLALIILCAAIAFSPRSGAQSFAVRPDDEVRRGQVVVEIRPGASIDAINARFGTATVARIYGTNFYRLATPNGKKENKYRKRLSKDADVLSASLNPLITTPINVFGRSVIGFPGDKPTRGQAQAHYLAQQSVGDLSALHSRSRGEGVIVAVIDTGVDRAHPDIAQHLWSDAREIPNDRIDNDGDGLIDDVDGWDFIANTDDTMERPGDSQSSVAGHGTFIAGLIALVAPGAKIMPVRAFTSEGVSDAFTVASAIKYATDHGARVINLSFGSPDESEVMHDAIRYARQRGVLLVAAVGNENKSNNDSPQFPANWDQEVMGVAALDSDNRKADFSNFGSNVSVSAPGVSLVSLFPESNNNADYAMWSGTSFAAPLASAEAALILKDNPLHDDVRGAIENSASSIDDKNRGFSGKLGKGRIDPLKALQNLEATLINRSEIKLAPSGVESDARGEAQVVVAGAEQWFEVEAEALQPRAAYKVVVNGNVIVDGAAANGGNAVTSNFGAFKVEFATNPTDSRLPLPASLNPVKNIRQVEVRDAQNRVVLSNTFGAPQPGAGVALEKEARLTSSGRAKGRARAEVESQREKLRVDAEDLAPGASYEIIADGMSLGSFAALSGGLRIEFTSDGSSGRALPASLRPVTRIQRIELRDSTGQTVLQGTFQAGGDDFGGGHGGGDDNGGGSGGSGGSGGGGSGGGGGEQEVEREARLNHTGADSDAEGKVKIKFRSSREELEIEAKRLDAGAQYTIIVDGFVLGTFTSDGSGEFDLKLSTEDGSLPSALRPVTNIRVVNIVNASGSTVLSGGPPG